MADDFKPTPELIANKTALYEKQLRNAQNNAQLVYLCCRDLYGNDPRTTKAFEMYSKITEIIV